MIPRWLLAGALALAACMTPRQIVLSIDTTAGIPCDIDRIRIVATAAGTATVERDLKDAQLPITITLLDDTPSGDFQLDISALKEDVEVMRTSGPLRFASQHATERVLLDTRCTPDAACTLEESMSAGAASQVPARFACRYAASAALDTYVDACSVPKFTSVLTDGRRVPVLVDLGSALAGSQFKFYGRPIHQMWVSKDGYVSFAHDNPDPTGVLTPGALDRDITHMGEPPPPQSVMAFWDTLALGPSGVCYVLDGTPPNRALRVTWEHACLTDVCASDNLNFTITIEEATQRVVLTYGQMTASNMDGEHGGNATVGVVDDAIGCSAAECALATGLCKDGVTPCGYSQVFSDKVQTNGVPNMQFVP